jgi:hypothetical protein
MIGYAPLRVTVAIVRVSFLTASLLVLFIVSSSSHLLEMLDALIAVADLHAVASAVLLVSGSASCVALSATTSRRRVEAFTSTQGIVLGNTLDIGTSQAVGVLANVAWLCTLAS